MAPVGFLFILISTIIFIITFSLSLKRERKIIYNELKEEADNGLIPQLHLEREKKGWLDERIRKVYIKAATTLAFRKMELKSSSGVSKIYYQNDVDNYRDFIGRLLSDPQNL